MLFFANSQNDIGREQLREQLDISKCLAILTWQKKILLVLEINEATLGCQLAIKARAYRMSSLFQACINAKKGGEFANLL